MKLQHPLFTNALAFVAAKSVRAWMQTLEYQIAFYDPTVDPVHPDFPRQMIYIFWHEYILVPIVHRGHSNLTMLLSQHRDADLLCRAAKHLGFDYVRGSSTRGGVTALLELERKGQKANLTITPDGPRGPRRTLAPGPVYLASKLGMPLVALGLGFHRPWRLRSWDRFAIPRPFSRARAVVSPPLPIPPNLDREGVEHYRRSAEQLLNRLTLEAEAWAEAGTRKANEQAIRPGPARVRLLRRDPPHALPRPCWARFGNDKAA